MTVNQWLGENNKIGIDIWEKKYRYGNESFDDWLHRVSGGYAELETLIRERRFLFGGRALTNRGVPNAGSYFNCYSIGYVPDSYDGIMEVAKNIGLTFKAEGGQGLSLSKIRPHGTSIKNRYKSDGILPFMRIFNTVTAETSQGGARKGALMMSLDIRHKEADSFINIKSEAGQIEKANLSLEVDDDFMNVVSDYYTTGKVRTITEKRNYSGHEVEYEITPIDRFSRLARNAHEWADPACLYTDRFRNYNLMQHDPEYEIETCNPCGEQPLPKHFCCNLGSLNLAEYVIDPFGKNRTFDYDRFSNDIEIAVRALDALIDENAANHPLDIQRENSLNYRNIGLGVMGYATALMYLGITYGSKEAKKFTQKLFRFLFRRAVRASADLAADKGVFPRYTNCVLDSDIIKVSFSEEEIEELRTKGLRNCSLISIAPTGSIATMINVSGGCEPEFAIKYTRKTESLNDGEDKFYDIYIPAAQRYIDRHGGDLPEYFIASQEIAWKDRVDVQAIMQNYVDTAISSTVNLPNSTTVDDVCELFYYAWQRGLKGITIYRDGCKRSGILTTASTPSQDGTEAPCGPLKRGDIIQVDDDVVGRIRHLRTGCGTLHCKAYFDPVCGDPLETYFDKGSAGGCNSFMVALSRVISIAMRSGCDLNAIIDQLQSAPQCISFIKSSGTSKGTSCPSSISYALSAMYHDVQADLGLCEDDGEVTALPHDRQGLGEVCPDCGNKLYFEGGCNSCKDCGYSKCN